MNRNSFCQASLIALVVGLTLAVVGGLTAWAAGAAEPALPSTGTEPQPPQTLAAPGVITGTITYAGTVTGTHLVWAGAFTTTLGGPPAFSTTRSGPGPYTITVAAGVYHIYAGMDADDSGGPPDPAVDPMGTYAHNPVTVTDGALITGVDIVLLDPAPPPTGTGSIRGAISYTGHVTAAHNVIIFASRQGEAGPPAYATVIPGPGPYTITNVADYTYTVGAFMDLGDDMGPPQPGEPFGWYDPAGDGWPDPVIVSGGNPATGVNITLHDPRYSLYLPLVLKADQQ
jgi:hypothetical protein